MYKNGHKKYNYIAFFSRWKFFEEKFKHTRHAHKIHTYRFCKKLTVKRLIKNLCAKLTYWAYGKNKQASL